MNVSWDDYSQLNGKIKAMFQTTNQIISTISTTSTTSTIMSTISTTYTQQKHQPATDAP